MKIVKKNSENIVKLILPQKCPRASQQNEKQNTGITVIIIIIIHVQVFVKQVG